LKRQRTKYPAGMEEYVKGIAKGRSSKEIAKAVSEYFGIEFSISQCRAYKKNHNIASGLDCRFKKGHKPANKGKKMSLEQYKKCKATMFRKGHIPLNKMQVGEYTHTAEGYLIQKIQEEGTQRQRFQFVHRAVWEKYHGAIPEGKLITFLDGNKDNCDISNLSLVDRRENLEINRSSLRFEQAELTEIGITIAKLKIAAKKRKLRENDCEIINKVEDEE